ncbi:hypothetical protein ACFYOK_29585 [Microbispora bryophytorum]|uniref:hypothetical protein n=1 Tax=Microbispora bryophytorum TaxID=1460882 RepID=UPI0033ED1D61
MGESTLYAADDLLDLLRAVREALDLPHAASLDGDKTRDEILGRRLLSVGSVLSCVLDDGVPADYLSVTARFLRDQTAKHPATGYVTHEQAMAEVKAGKSWSEAVALPGVAAQPSGGAG